MHLHSHPDFHPFWVALGRGVFPVGTILVFGVSGEGGSSSYTDWPRVTRHRNTLRVCAQPLQSSASRTSGLYATANNRLQLALSPSKLRQGSQAGQGPWGYGCDLGMPEWYSADDRFRKWTGRDWLNRGNSYVYFPHQKFLLLLFLDEAYFWKHFWASLLPVQSLLHYISPVLSLISQMKAEPREILSLWLNRSLLSLINHLIYWLSFRYNHKQDLSLSLRFYDKHTKREAET